MAKTSDRVWYRIKRKGRGWVFVPRDFLDLGSRGSVDQTLRRLQGTGRIRRLARGLYDYPKQHRRFGDLSPSLDSMAQALARSTGSKIQVAGAHSANMLGLSSQVPAVAIYITDGPSRKVVVGNQVITFKHAAPRSLSGAGTTAGSVYQALRFLGRDGVMSDTIQNLRNTLSPGDKAQLLRLQPDLPAWMRPAVDRIAEDAGTGEG
jgi:hypothetical protein